MQPLTLKHTKRTLRFIEEHHDNCSECSRPFKNGDTTHLGYSKTKKLIYVGNCHSTLLKETIIRHSYSARAYTIPEDNAVLWRFMDYTKFLSLLKTKSLFFPRADNLGDPFEGAKGLFKNKRKWEKFYKEFFVQAIKTAPGQENKTHDEKEVAKRAKKLLGDLKQFGKKQFEETFINCWYENPYESDAMWKLYSSTLNQAVAIKTTYKRLFTALGKDPNIKIGRVNYIDYSKQFVDINNVFWFKRKSFEYEREVRAIVVDATSKEKLGKLIPVDTKVLIKEVVFSPKAENWFKSIADDMKEMYGFNKKIRMSEMAQIALLS